PLHHQPVHARLVALGDPLPELPGTILEIVETQVRSSTPDPSPGRGVGAPPPLHPARARAGEPLPPITPGTAGVGGGDPAAPPFHPGVRPTSPRRPGGGTAGKLRAGAFAGVPGRVRVRRRGPRPGPTLRPRPLARSPPPPPTPSRTPTTPGPH